MSKDEKKPKFYERVTNQNYSQFNDYETVYEEEEEKSNDTKLYDRLNVSRTAPPSEIKRKYRHLSSQNHPDQKSSKDTQEEEELESDDTKRVKNDDYYSRKQTELNSAKDVLLDPRHRLAYDYLGEKHSSAVILRTKEDQMMKEIPLDVFKMEVTESKKVIRKRYVELLTHATSNQIITIDSRFGNFFPPIVTEAESKFTYSYPVGKFDVLRFITSSTFQITQTPQFLRALQYRHYFRKKRDRSKTEKNVLFSKYRKKKKEENDFSGELNDDKTSYSRLDSTNSFMGAELRFLFTHILFILENQWVINEREDLRLKVTNNFILFPLLMYLGFDIFAQKKIANPFLFDRKKPFSTYQDLVTNPLVVYSGFSFPIFRRIFFLGMKSRDTDFKVSLGSSVLRTSFHHDFLELESENGRSNSFRLEVDVNQQFEWSWPGFQVCLFMLKNVVDRHTHIGYGIGVDTMYGLSVRGHFSRDTHHFSFPVFLPCSAKGVFCGIVCPFLGYFGWKYLMKKYFDPKKKRKEDWKMWKDKWWAITTKERNMFLKNTKSDGFQRRAKKSFGDESQRNGLIIVEAKYGYFEDPKKKKKKMKMKMKKVPSLKLKKKKEEEEEEKKTEKKKEEEDSKFTKLKLGIWKMIKSYFFEEEDEKKETEDEEEVYGECYINVTSSLQLCVKSETSRLVLPKGTKSNLEGFYDPCPDFEAKRLFVRYKFRGVEQTIIVDDEDELELPLLHEFLE